MQQMTLLKFAKEEAVRDVKQNRRERQRVVSSRVKQLSGRNNKRSFMTIILLAIVTIGHGCHQGGHGDEDVEPAIQLLEFPPAKDPEKKDSK